MEEVITLTKKLSQMPTKALSSIKTAIIQSWNNTLNQQLNLERDLQSYCGDTDNYQEGITAFIEKKAPKFKTIGV